jgi:hypothetical protein
MENICHIYLEEIDKSIEDYWDHCGDLCYEVFLWAEKKGLRIVQVIITRSGKHVMIPTLFTSPLLRFAKWNYHIVIEIGGFIHDAWFPEVLRRNEYLQANFGHYTDIECKRHAE